MSNPNKLDPYKETLKKLKRQHDYYIAKRIVLSMMATDLAIKVQHTIEIEDYEFELESPGEFSVVVKSKGKMLDADQILSICQHMEDIRQEVLDDQEDSPS